jgi:hypothetical protein
MGVRIIERISWRPRLLRLTASPQHRSPSRTASARQPPSSASCTAASRAAPATTKAPPGPTATAPQLDSEKAGMSVALSHRATEAPQDLHPARRNRRQIESVGSVGGETGRCPGSTRGTGRLPVLWSSERSMQQSRSARAIAAWYVEIAPKWKRGGEMNAWLASQISCPGIPEPIRRGSAQFMLAHGTSRRRAPLAHRGRSRPSDEKL